jgi:hypothetical protein
MFKIPHFILIWIYATQINIVVLKDFSIIIILKFYDLISCSKPYWPREPQQRCLQGGDLFEMTGDSWEFQLPPFIIIWIYATQINVVVLIYYFSLVALKFYD